MTIRTDGDLSLSVVVPATNTPETLEHCLAAIAIAADGSTEVIVVDGPRSAGPAFARNRGAERARNEIIVFVDADVEVASDALERILAAFGADPALTAIFGSYDDAPAHPAAVSTFRNLLHHHVHNQGKGVATTFWAGLGAIRRDAFLEAGGFDERRYHEASIEDIELGMRLAADGKRIVLDPAIQGRHLKRWTLRSMIDADLNRRGVPWVRLLLERGSGSATLNLGWRHRATMAATLVFVGASITRRPILAGASLGTILFANRSFYALLARRGGPKLLGAGIGLHLTHQLVAATAVPVALVSHLGARLRGSRASSE